MTTLVLGTATARRCAQLLGADLIELPELEFNEEWSEGTELEAWRAVHLDGQSYDTVVVVLEPGQRTGESIVATPLGVWVDACERPLAEWFVALSVASQRCSDGGRVVAFVTRPASKDAATWSLQACVADGVDVMARSFALLHEDRNVAVHVIARPHHAAFEWETVLVEDRISMLSNSNIASVVLHEGEL